MEQLVNNLKSTALSVGEMLTPVLKESKFLETGVLTPQEFVAAGDHLVHHCPTWSWARADPKGVRPYLPENKQFLITRNVPCSKRCFQMEYDPTQEKVLSDKEVGNEEGFGGDEDSGWVDTHHFESVAPVKSLGESKDLEKKADDDSQEEEEAVDLDDLVDSGALEEDDPGRFVVAEKSIGNDSEVEKPRTYDLHITYDKYYQVPRLWLAGYNESRRPLTSEEMNEDFSADHANKTITMETHPHLEGPPRPSVHPCRHAETMKRLMDQLTENGKELSVEQYLLIFLKFVQAIIPTIEYDYTRSIKL